jgi:DNA helicase II / ATP-dependent DNA helicase PcrA
VSDFVEEQKKLNDQQQRAIQTTDGPVLVVAGAGTGKTTVIVERICRLLDKTTSAKRVLALTFTEKAAAEMLERVNAALNSYELELPIMTFNAYGETMLRRYAADIGLARNFKVLGESAKIVFLRERIDELKLDYFSPVGSPDSQLGDIAEFFSHLKQNVITPDEYLAFVKKMPVDDEADNLEKTKHQELAHAYETYIRLSREASVIDFDDQIYLAVELLRKRPNVLKEVQNSYDYVMVDEFQDTNAMQSVLVDLIVAPKNNLFVVGDDDQSIYGWRGATLANILNFKDRYPNLLEVTLVENYRSTKQILDASYRLIQHNNPHRLEEKLKINKRLKAQKTGAEPQTLAFNNPDEELSWIATDIKRRIDSGVAPGSIAVLGRSNATAKALHAHLDYLDIEHVVAGQRYDLYQSTAVRVLLEALRAVADPHDNTSLYHTLVGPLFSLPTDILSELNGHIKRNHDSLQKAIAESEESSLATAREAFVKIAGWRDKIGTTTVGQLAFEILDSSGYMQHLKRAVATDPYAQQSAARLSELFNTLREFEQIALTPSVVAYIDSLPALMAAGESGEDTTLDLSGQVVNVLTVHKAKGLEWPIVYIANCTRGSFPLPERSRGIAMPAGLLASRVSEADSHEAEERRLMYVAMTRAKDELILTHSQNYNSGLKRKPSQFLEQAFSKTEFTVKAPSGVAAINTISAGNLEAPTKASLPKSMLNGNQMTLSVSQIESYLKCPLDFYYEYILSVPAEPNPVMEAGTVMHKLAEDINRGLISGNVPELPELRDRLKTEWPRSGYMTPGHRDRAYARAVEGLEKMHTRMMQENRVPLAVEEKFSVTIDEAQLTIRGKIDAVLPFGNSVEIVDYKTGHVDSQKKADDRARSSEQLTLYALAWQALHNEIPEKVTLGFVIDDLWGRVGKTQRGIDGARGRAINAADGIRAGSFQPKGDHRYCAHPPIQ